MATWDLRQTQHHLLICNGASCMKAGANQLVQAIRNEIRKMVKMVDYIRQMDFSLQKIRL